MSRVAGVDNSARLELRPLYSFSGGDWTTRMRDLILSIESFVEPLCAAGRVTRHRGLTSLMVSPGTGLGIYAVETLDLGFAEVPGMIEIRLENVLVRGIRLRHTRYPDTEGLVQLRYGASRCALVYGSTALDAASAGWLIEQEGEDLLVTLNADTFGRAIAVLLGPSSLGSSSRANEQQASAKVEGA